MSFGIKPYDFVQQVYYEQEKVVLDFHPDDDKYKEVLFEANLVLQELQNVEDWSWLREQLILGPVFADPYRVPNFDMPEWVYKPSTVFGDCVKLQWTSPRVRHGEINWSVDPIKVPWASDGTMPEKRRYDMDPHNTALQSYSQPLRAYFYGNTVTFNRPLYPAEAKNRIAVTDVQRRIGQFHICNKDCPRDAQGNCTLIEPVMLTEVPDPNYVIMLTASRHAAGSPPAANRAMELADNAAKILSAMRSNDVAHTTPDFIPEEDIHWIGVF